MKSLHRFIISFFFLQRFIIIQRYGRQSTRHTQQGRLQRNDSTQRTVSQAHLSLSTSCCLFILSCAVIRRFSTHKNPTLADRYSMTNHLCFSLTCLCAAYMSDAAFVDALEIYLTTRSSIYPTRCSTAWRI